ncbi:uncharacterized protein MELLADRAFT_113230 [Melampsora larici-populina 98AG31]|uniref:RGS domain-containing protein n=1 Tax=Melampsora larici-populina (strain 98AG31 / pathotype 3-4-7) TaxID=747676 RepID=F4S969_MELLP|nr:uncharacterized protein MELLADRAFT_113230 [Melampsora larici-populina 98AG31]EGF98765.1 hypothetical protein MELLADRAFT_113230 [Melampsora larici-populina 98AG31]
MSENQQNTTKDLELNKLENGPNHTTRTNLTPVEAPYSMKGLLSLPKRLFFPPPLPSVPSCDGTSFETGGKSKISSTSSIIGIPIPRWITSSPVYLVELSDVLEDVHFSPLSARDFEDFLVYDEYTPENLYFYHWLKNYKALFIKETKTLKAENITLDSIPTILHLQFQFGLQNFFSGGPYELNIPCSVRQTLFIEAESSIDPSIFNAVNAEVMTMLEVSKKHWLSKQCGNAGHNRRLFGIVLGLFIIAISFVVEFILFFFSHSRIARIGPGFLLWFGVMLELQCSRNTCPIIYAFGNLRQLNPWEILRNKNKTSSIDKTDSSLGSGSINLSEFQSNHWIPAQKIHQITPIFSPVTRIESPLMTRILRYNVISGAWWAILPAIVWIAFWVPLPTKSK